MDGLIVLLAVLGVLVVLAVGAGIYFLSTGESQQPTAPANKKPVARSQPPKPAAPTSVSKVPGPPLPPASPPPGETRRGKNTAPEGSADDGPPTAQLNPLQVLWSTTAGKAAVVVIAILVAGVGGGVTLYIANENNHSYAVGHEWGLSGGAVSNVVKGGVSVEAYCLQGFVASGFGPAGIARDPFFEGCRDAVDAVINGG